MPATRSALRTRSAIRAVVTGLALSLVVAGCTSGDDDPPDRTPETSPSPSVTSPEPEELSFAAFGTEEQLAAYRELGEAFERAEPGVSVEVTGYPDTPATLQAVLGTEGPAEPTPDVFLLDSDYLTGLVAGDSEAVQPLDDLLEERDVAFGDDHQRVALTELSAEAALQCMPAEMSPLVVYVNRDLLPNKRRLRSLGVVLPRATDPWTWTEFVATARAIAADTDEVLGTYLPISVDLVTAFVRSAGDDVVDDVFQPTRIDLTSDEDLEVLSQLAVLAADASVSVTPEQESRRSDLARFTDGDLGLLFGTRADLPVLRDSEVPFQVLPLPSFSRYRAVSSVTGYCISGESTMVDTAADFIAFAVSQQGATILAESGALVPARLDVASSTAFTQPDQLPSNYRVYADAVRRSEPMPFAAEWPELSERVSRQLSQVLTDPTVDLGIELPRRMERLLRRSEQVLAPDEVEEPDPAESDASE